jgi:hypothetical protein
MRPVARKLEKTVITLEAQDVQQLEEIILDEDKDQALKFLIEVIDQKVQCAQAETHKTAIEGGRGESAAHTWHQSQH